MTMEQYLHLILDAEFYDIDGTMILSHKDLPANTWFHVTGFVDNEPFKAVCMLKSEKELWIGGETYTFIPNEAKAIENAIPIKLKGFFCANQILLFEGQLMSLKDAFMMTLLMRQPIRAYGEAQKHSRFGTNMIVTSIVEKFAVQGKKIYFCTENTMYQIV